MRIILQVALGVVLGGLVMKGIDHAELETALAAHVIPTPQPIAATEAAGPKPKWEPTEVTEEQVQAAYAKVDSCKITDSHGHTIFCHSPPR